MSATDGVGTKLKLAQEAGSHRGLGIDLVAMCANDVLTSGALPLFFLDYFATSKLLPEVASEVVAGIADGCVEAGCALIGGETAEMPGIYPDETYDLAGFCVGAAERNMLIDPSQTKAGDVAIALASSGCHANGYSLVRGVLKRSKSELSAPFDSNKTLGEVLLTPTTIYTKAYQTILETLGDVKAIGGMAHITGGGLIENPPRAFSEELCLNLDLTTWELPPIFRWLKETGPIEVMECLRVFNCGIGMLVFVDKDNADKILKAFSDTEYTAWVAGELSARKKDKVIFDNMKAWE